MNKSRYIKKDVDNAIKQETGFRCAWCGEYLTVRHHITEYSLGGPNAIAIVEKDFHGEIQGKTGFKINI